MRNLKLTILIDPGTKAELINVLGTDYVTFNGNKWIQYTFPNIKMLTAFKLQPIVQLLTTYEGGHQQLSYYMLHLADDNDLSYSPVYFQCSKGDWSVVQSNGGVETQHSNSLFNLI